VSGARSNPYRLYQRIVLVRQKSRIRKRLCNGFLVTRQISPAEGALEVAWTKEHASELVQLRNQS